MRGKLLVRRIDGKCDGRLDGRPFVKKTPRKPQPSSGSRVLSYHARFSPADRLISPVYSTIDEALGVQLTGEEIRKRNLVPNSPIRRASADLTVGHILVGNKKHTDSVSIEPQQMFIIVSRERVTVPVGLAANALPKTGLCNEGILCINTGIIDTGYSGLISTTAINFGKTPYLISPGDVFLRVVFHPLDGDKAHESVDSGKPIDDDEYLRLRRSYSIKFPAQFMDVPGQVDRITDKVLARHTNDLVRFVGVVTLIYALWNIGAYVLLQRQSATPTAAQRTDVAPKAAVDSLRAQLARLQAMVDSLGRREAPTGPGATGRGKRP